QHFADRLFGGIVRGGHEIGRALARHLQRLDLVEVAAQPGRGLARRLFHDGDEAGMCGHFVPNRSASRHPELVSGAMNTEPYRYTPRSWMLKHVQHDADDTRL